MIYSKALFLMSGEAITITESEEKKIQETLIGGAEWVHVQGNLINSKSISKVGNHHATAEINRIEEQQKETNLKILEPSVKKIEYQEPDFYIDSHTGEKMYS